MSKFRSLKAHLRGALASSQGEQWDAFVLQMETLPPKELVSPLISCLPLGGEATDRAAVALGRTVARLAEESIEDARNVVRRLMWHMNEESGNIGWGIPEAFAEILIAHRGLAEAFGPLLLSYITHTGKDDNYCDNDILRRSCFGAVCRLIKAWPEFTSRAFPALQAGRLDPDPVCRALVLSCLPTD